MPTKFFNDAAHGPHRAISDFGASKAGLFLGLGVSDTVTSGSPTVLKGGPGAWVGTVESQANAENLDWHGNGETLNWRGPWSRYWFNDVRTRTSRVIKRKRAFWTQAPISTQEVLGCAILVVGEVKTLSLVCFLGSTIYVYQRPFAETYATHEWPADWTRVSFLTLSVDYNWPATPIFFNESGTECQGLVGLPGATNSVKIKKRIKISVGAGTASFSEHDVIGSYEDSMNVVDNSTETTSIAIGDQPDGPCTAVNSVCTEEDGEGVCTRSQKNFTSSGTINGESERIFTNLTPHIIAVDYQGDTEILCSYREEHDAKITSTASFNHTFQSDTNAPNLPGLVGNSASNVVWSGGSKTYINSATVNLQTVDSNTSQDQTASTTHGSGGDNTTLSITKQHSNYERHITYMDLRHGHISYAERTILTDETTVLVDQDQETGTRSGSLTIDRIHVVQLGATKHTARAAAQEVIDLAETLVNINLSGGGAVTCGGNNDDSTGTPVTFNYFDEAHKTAILRAAVFTSSAPALGCATDKSGNSLYSCTTYDTNGATHGYWNFLTGGDPVALLGMTGANPRMLRAALIDFDNSYELVI